MNCPKCNDSMVLAKATAFGDDYHYCRTCKKELSELQALVKPAGIDSQDALEIRIGYYGQLKAAQQASQWMPKAGDPVRCKTKYASQFTDGRIYILREDYDPRIGTIRPTMDDSGSTTNGLSINCFEPVNPSSQLQGLAAWTTPTKPDIRNFRVGQIVYDKRDTKREYLITSVDIQTETITLLDIYGRQFTDKPDDLTLVP